MDFENLKNKGKTVAYKESESEINDAEWKLWGKRITPDETFFVYYKICDFEEAKQYEQEGILN